MLSHAENELLTRTDNGTPMGSLLRRFWLPALLSSEIAEPDSSPVRVKIMGEELIAFRDSLGRTGLLDGFCAHRGAPLFFGRNEDCGLRCVYHGWKYDVDGNCIDMPNEPPTSTFKERIRQSAYPTREAGGVIWAYMGPGDPPAELPGLEWLRVPASHVHIEKYVVESNYLQALEGDHDSSHASHLHSTLDGQLVSKHIGRDSGLGSYHIGDKSPKLHILQTEYGILTGARRNAGEGKYLWRIVPWLKPFYSLIAQEPGQPLLLNVRVPIDNENSWFYRVSYHPTRPLSDADRESFKANSALYSERIPGSFRPVENLDNDYLISRELQQTATFSGIKSIPAQDRAVSERMAPVKGYPGIADRSREHLASADAAIVQIRKNLLRSIASFESGAEPPEVAHPDIYFVRAPAVILDADVSFDIGAARYINGEDWDRQSLSRA
jgi:phthalate 4,5-dioxygenase oxygenase subunit